MSRNINWHILFPKQTTISQPQLTAIRHLLANTGFRFINPHNGQIMLINGGGMGLIPVPDEASAFQFISTHSTSLVTLWKEDTDISLEFDPLGANFVELASTYGWDDDSLYGSISLSINHTYLRKSNQMAWIVGNIHQLFGQLCNCMSSPFGFALDEWSLECYTNTWHIQKDVAAHLLPSILFPVGYYRAGYFPDFSTSMFERLGYKCDSVDSVGHIISNLDELLTE